MLLAALLFGGFHDRAHAFGPVEKGERAYGPAYCIDAEAPAALNRLVNKGDQLGLTELFAVYAEAERCFYLPGASYIMDEQVSRQGDYEVWRAMLFDTYAGMVYVGHRRGPAI